MEKFDLADDLRLEHDEDDVFVYKTIGDAQITILHLRLARRDAREDNMIETNDWWGWGD